MFAAVPVPYSTTFCRIWLAADATAGSTTCLGFGFACQIGWPSASRMLITGMGLTCCPPVASVPYAELISSVLTSFVPRTADRYGSSGRFGSETRWQHRIPIRLATSTTVCAPSSSISCAYTVFTEEIVACSKVRLP